MRTHRAYRFDTPGRRRVVRRGDRPQPGDSVPRRASVGRSRACGRRRNGRGDHRDPRGHGPARPPPTSARSRCRSRSASRRRSTSASPSRAHTVPDVEIDDPDRRSVSTGSTLRQAGRSPATARVRRCATAAARSAAFTCEYFSLVVTAPVPGRVRHPGHAARRRGHGRGPLGPRPRTAPPAASSTSSSTRASRRRRTPAARRVPRPRRSRASRWSVLGVAMVVVAPAARSARRLRR